LHNSTNPKPLKRQLALFLYPQGGNKMQKSIQNKRTALGLVEAKHTTQKIEFIALNQIVPGIYQRPTHPTQVANIVKSFDESKLGMLTVSQRDGKYVLIDGSHRVSVLRTLGYTHTQCLVLCGLTCADEAEYFRKQDKDKRFLKPIDFFNAGLIARDEKCLKINEIVKANGLVISKAHNSFNEIAAINTVFEIYDLYGARVLDDTLRIIVQAWHGLSKATQSDCLMGVAEFVNRYGMVDFAERLCSKFTIIWNHYTEALQTRGAGGQKKNRRKFCRVLVEHYNKGFASNNKKRLSWIDDEVTI